MLRQQQARHGAPGAWHCERQNDSSDVVRGAAAAYECREVCFAGAPCRPGFFFNAFSNDAYLQGLADCVDQVCSGNAV